MEVGTTTGWACSMKNEQNDAPQESHEWRINLAYQSKNIQEQYNVDYNGWAIDTTFKVTVISW